jgi:hypothetical protein
MQVEASFPHFDEDIERRSTFYALSLGVPSRLSSKNAVTQQTSITTGVTCNGGAGVITTVSATTATTATSTFTVTNDCVLSNHKVLLQLISYAGTPLTNGIPILSVGTISNGSFQISISNYGANALSGALVILFVLV